jgi:hypothetical protein
MGLFIMWPVPIFPVELHAGTTRDSLRWKRLSQCSNADRSNCAKSPTVFFFTLLHFTGPFLTLTKYISFR